MCYSLFNQAISFLDFINDIRCLVFGFLAMLVPQLQMKTTPVRFLFIFKEFVCLFYSACGSHFSTSGKMTSPCVLASFTDCCTLNLSITKLLNLLGEIRNVASVVPHITHVTSNSSKQALNNSFCKRTSNNFCHFLLFFCL